MNPLLLFDFDGVIADSLAVFEKAVIAALSTLGYSFIKSRSDFLNLFDDNLYSSLLKNGVNEPEMIKIFEYTSKNAEFSKITLYPGILDVVTRLSKISKIAIVSSNRENQINLILKLNHALKTFPVVFGLNSGKGKAEKIKRAFSIFDADPQKSLYVVDTVGDLKEAKEAGIKSVAVSWGWHDKEKLLSHGPDYFIERPDDLIKLAEEIIK
jgi:phosphoglycolate phosphatase